MDDPGMDDGPVDLDWLLFPVADNAQSIYPLDYPFATVSDQEELEQSFASSIETTQQTENTQYRVHDVPEGAADSMAPDIGDLTCFGESALAPSIEETQPTENTQDRQPDVPEGAANSMASNNRANDGRARPKKPSPQEWNRQKPTIIALYTEEGKTVEEIIRFMEDEHSFYASEKQYRCRLRTKWHVHKYVNAEDKQIMSQIQQQRKQDEGKDTEFEVWNQPVAAQKITRFMKDMRNTTSADVPTYPIPEHITFKTPPPDFKTPPPDSSLTSSRRSRPSGSSSATHDKAVASWAPTATSSFDHYMQDGATSNATAQTGQSTTDDTRRVQLMLTPDDLAELSCLHLPATDMELWRGKEKLKPMAAMSRLMTNVVSQCSGCGDLHTSANVSTQGVEFLLASTEPNLDMKDQSLLALLRLAIEHNEGPVVRHLVRRCDKATKFAQRIHTSILCTALHHRRDAIFRQLLLHSLDVDAEGRCGARGDLLTQARSTLRGFITEHIKRTRDCRSVAEAIALLYRARVITAKLWRDEVLWVALRFRRTDVLRVCLRRPTGAELDIDELIHRAAEIRQIMKATRSVETAATLVAAAEVSDGVVSETGATALHLAASLLLGDEVQRLIAAGADVNAATEKGETALHMLAGLSSDGTPVARILLYHGASAAATDAVGDTPLHHAARHAWGPWRLMFASLLLHARADIHATNDRGETPHLTAALHQDLVTAEATVQWLLDQGADAHALDHDGNMAWQCLQARLEARLPWQAVARQRPAFGTLDMLTRQGQPWTAENHNSSTGLRTETLQTQLGSYAI